MARIQNVLIIVALCAVSMTLAQVSQGAPHSDQGGPHSDQGGPSPSQGGPHQSQGRVRRQAEDDDNSDIFEGLNANWTTCDITAAPRLSCHDCQTRLICKPIGGLLKPCRNPYKPYCNNGFCSPVPSTQCA